MAGVAEQLDRIRQRDSTLAAAHARFRDAERERLRAVEDLITTSLAVFEAINDAARAAQALPEAERTAAAPQVVAHYRQWFDGSQQELRAVLSLESAGCAVAGALDFKRALAD